ncbi:PAS domain-containing sensor histidine kinase [Geomonas propionica]|uniref:Oxygen sensor histidine kinase NreB n=1 Tax=Geomonas propionica TaxID=2798582 RepID=A0ABS0YPF0_9BACT|nr:PAS domain-containing sensor histidine kinase [Geomonas propionica]MBJ6799342.1 PAS domain S-box protein [Geomonas propionica]
MYRFGNIAAPLLASFATLIATLYWADTHVVLEPTALLPLLNTVFLALIPCIIVFVSTRLFLAVGHLPMLMLGCGMLALGGAGAVSGWFIGQADGPNITVTIYNSGALLSGLLLVVSPVIPLLEFKETPPRLRLPLVLICYLAVALVSGSIVAAAVTGLAGPFIVQGEGATSTGSAVLAAAIACYAATAALSLGRYLQTRLEQLRWYATGLALFATGLTGVMLQKSVGSPIGWAGRTAQYTGGICILVGVLIFWRSILNTGRPIAEAYGEASRRRISELEQMNAQLQRVVAEQQVTQKALQENRMLLVNIISGTSDAIFAKDLLGRYTLFNAAAERFVGKGAAEVLGQDDGFLFSPEESAAVMAYDRKVIDSGVVNTYQEVVADVSGRTVTFLSTKGPLFDATGAPSGLFGISRDISQLKKAHDELDRVLQEQSIILENAPIAIFKIVDRKQVWINRKAEELFQYTKKEMELQTTRKLYPSDEAYEKLGREAYPVLAQGLPFETEQELIRKDGARLRVRYVGKAINPADMSQGILWLLEDVTERRLMEEALREGERLYRTLLENVPAIIYNYSTKRGGLFYSPHVARVFGYPLQEFYDDPMLWKNSLHPDDVGKIEAILAGIRDQGQGEQHVEYRVRNSNGAWIWLHDALIKSEIAGDDAVIFGIAQDITERKNLQLKLAESELKFRHLVMNAPFLVTNVDRAGNIEFINRCSEGFDPETVIGTSSYGYLAGESKEIYRVALERTFEQQAPQRIIVSGLGDNGTVRWFETVLGPLVTDGKMASAIQVTIDITERKLAEMALQDARDELERQVAARTESLTAANTRLRAEVEERMRAEDQILEHQKKMEALTQELSLTEERERERIAGELHDQVGQHLILVKLKLQWLANELSSGKELAVAEEIDKLLSQSIQDIRSLTFQLRPPILANAGLGPAINWLAEELRENYGLNFEISGDQAPLSLRYEVRSSIFQAVREILLNVVKHSHCTLARISLGSNAGCVRIEISDNGTGFDPDEAARKKCRTGGFGLFNLRKKIEYLGGEFRIETELGAGTRVLITVPQDAVGASDGTATESMGAAG